jgi:hypothetical protein
VADLLNPVLPESRTGPGTSCHSLLIKSFLQQESKIDSRTPNTISVGSIQHKKHTKKVYSGAVVFP